MTGTAAVADAVQLAVVERNGFIESRHAGSAVVLSPSGVVERALGDPFAPVFARSCLKPFQAVAVMSSGVHLSGAHAAIATASHWGTPAHVRLATDLLERAGLAESDLQCPADWPGDVPSRDELVRAGRDRSRLYMNCSGKHAAMLLACVSNGWPTESYLDPGHPLQRRIREVIELYTGERIAATGVDGCGAPVHAVSLVGVARGIGRVSSAPGRVASASNGRGQDAAWGTSSQQTAPHSGAGDSGTPDAGGAHDDSSRNGALDSGALDSGALDAAAAELTQSVLAHGWAIDGPGRPDEIVISRLHILAKTGAEAVMVMGTADGTAVALKILDGNLRAASAVAVTLLAESGAVDQAAAEQVVAELDLDVLGGGRAVGRVRVDLTA